MGDASFELGRSELMVIVFTDVFDSVGMKRRLGDKPFYKLLSRHNELFDRAATGTPGTQIIKATGDGFLARLPSASAAARMALQFQAMLADESWAPEPVLVRMGIHVGEALEVPGPRGERDLSGLAVDVAARIMSLAMPGQVLLTRTAFDDARQYVREGGTEGAAVRETRWLAHGQYVIKGSEDPLDVYEVGTVGKAPLRAPPDSDKARRSIRVEEEELLGWRPGPRLRVPERPGWVLEKKIGEGGFGEVWLCVQEKTRAKRVLKFCFDAGKVRYLRRELTLFRVLREELGDRPDIVRVHDVRLDKPPYYLESDYTEAGSLEDWVTARGGLESLPVCDRIEIMARVADAVAAAHGVGVLHKDLKPGNILMFRGEEGKYRPRLADLGIGDLTDDRAARVRNITMGGFTQAAGSDRSAASSTGTPMYMPPEVLAGKPFTTQGDVYALGVMLYQMALGDLKRPLGVGWERDIEPVDLREDIRKAVTADPRERFASAAQLAQNLRRLEQRRCARRRKRVIRVAAVTGVGGAVLVSLGVAGTSMVVAWNANEQRVIETQSERDAANLERQRAERAMRRADELNSLLRVMLRAPDPRDGRWRKVSPSVMLDAAVEYLDDDSRASASEFPDVRAEAQIMLAQSLSGLGRREQSLRLSERALAYRAATNAGTAGHAEALHWHAYVLRDCQRYEEAMRTFEASMSLRRSLMGDESPEYAETIYEYGVLLRTMGQLDDAEAYLLRARSIRERLPREDRHAQIELARTYNSLARFAHDSGRFDEALEWADQSLAKRTALFPNGHRDIGRCHMTLGQVHRDCGRLGASVESFRRAVTAFESVFGPDHTEVWGAKRDLARSLLDTGDASGALVLLDVIRRVLEQQPAEDRNAMDLAQTSLFRALALARLNRAEEAIADARLGHDAVSAHWSTLNPGHWQIAQSTCVLGEVLMRAGKVEEAIVLLGAAADAWLALGRSPARTAEALRLACSCAVEAKRRGLVLDGIEQRADLWRRELERLKPGA